MPKIRILFFIEELCSGGAEKVLCDLVNVMDQDRFEITVQTLWKADPARYLAPGIRYRYCYAQKSRANRFRSRLEAGARLTYPLHIRGNYDIEIAYLECGATKIMASSANRRPVKLAWVHCDMRNKLKEVRDQTRFLEKSAAWYKKYDRVVCVSQSVKNSFDNLFPSAPESLVLYNTVDDAAIRMKAALIPEQVPRKKRPTVVAVGRLTYQKAYDRLLRAHRELLRNGVEHDLWIVGEGEKRGELETIIAESGLSASVQLLGYRENPYPFMKAADLLVCSSYSEGLSTFVLEGLILGKAIVTTRCSGMQELLGDSEYGLIVENSEDALFSGMRRMLESAQLREEYEGKASQRGKDFSAASLTAATEAFFESLLR